MYRNLTVGENVWLSATLRLGRPRAEVNAAVDAVLASMSLLHRRDAVVGDENVRGVSGGEPFVAAAQKLVAITAENPLRLARLAWHLGNRHLPTEIGVDALWIREDHVIEDMLKRLGAHVRAVRRPFRPEGGAYGHGRTHGHDHAH